MNTRVAASVVALLFAASVQTGFAQIRGVGTRVGPTFTTFGGDAEWESKTGIMLSGFFIYSLSEQLAVYPELSYVRKGAGSTERPSGQDPVTGLLFEQTLEFTNDLDYVELQVPIAVMIPARRTAVRARVYAGPSVALEVKCRSDLSAAVQSFSPTGTPLARVSTSTSGGCEDEIGRLGGPLFTATKRLDFGLIFGAGVDVGVGRGALTGDLRYDFGLADIQDGTGGTIRNRAFEVLFGYVHYFSG